MAVMAVRRWGRGTSPGSYCPGGVELEGRPVELCGEVAPGQWAVLPEGAIAPVTVPAKQLRLRGRGPD
jgi:hypothetical protein